MDNREVSCGTVTTQGPAVSVSIIAEGHDVARLPLHTNSTIIIQADPLPQLLHRERGSITERHLQWALIRVNIVNTFPRVEPSVVIRDTAVQDITVN